ncbi:hypothetical protein OIO90_005718 [Microbotryomycetes sp. JL221]|nr:hypothetical protein OIO90_005718 [Microbotryomycetes sp. JL221]
MAATRVVSLRQIATDVLQVYWPLVIDVGDATYAQLEPLLSLSTAAQLQEIERNSPHLERDTEPIWKQLCTKDFVSIKIAVEDGHMTKEPDSWRKLHELESRKQEAREDGGSCATYERPVQRLQGQQGGDRQDRWHPNGETSETEFDARPKTLFDKAKVNSRRITRVFAPKARSVRVASTSTTIGSTRNDLTMRDASSNSTLKPQPPSLPVSAMIDTKRPMIKPKVTTVTRPTRMSLTDEEQVRPSIRNHKLGQCPQISEQGQTLTQQNAGSFKRKRSPSPSICDNKVEARCPPVASQHANQRTASTKLTRGRSLAHGGGGIFLPRKARK